MDEENVAVMIYTTMYIKSHGLLFDFEEVQKAFPRYTAQRLYAYIHVLTEKGLFKKVIIKKDDISLYKITWRVV